MATVNFMQLDLGDLASVGVFTKQFADKYDRLDCLINNAGIMAAPFGKTKGIPHSSSQSRYNFLLILLLEYLMPRNFKRALIMHT